MSVYYGFSRRFSTKIRQTLQFLTKKGPLSGHRRAIVRKSVTAAKFFSKIFDISWNQIGPGCVHIMWRCA